MPNIRDVQAFWDAHPLFAGEATAPVGSREFFQQHRAITIDDNFAGAINPGVFPKDVAQQSILDVGCGVGFWLVEFWERGARQITGIDLSPRSVALARRRCEMFGVTATMQAGNAEQLPFADGAFSHVNCAGVVHHTPDPQQAVREIARVLKPGGTAAISVYYRNATLRFWSLIGPAVRTLPIGLAGRGREGLVHSSDASDIVRRFDGTENPIGRCYSRAEFRQLVQPLRIEEEFFQLFPARALPFHIKKPVHIALQWAMPFMIWARLRKD